MKEATIQTWIKTRLEKEFGDDIYIFKVPVGQYTSRRGLPDLVMSVYGNFVAIEVKTDTGETTKLQDHELQKINASGGRSLVLRGKDEVALNSLISLFRSWGD